MKQVFSLMLISAVVGVLAGGTTAYFKSSISHDAKGVPQVDLDAILAHSVEAKTARVEVDESNFDFGTMQQGRRKSHTFVFKNLGDIPLTLREGAKSCKCTFSSATKDPIPPGGTGTVTLEWNAITGTGPFRQTAKVYVNDTGGATVEQVDLVIHGEVIDAEGIEPRELSFATITAGESKSSEVYVMAMFQDDLIVSDPVLSDEMTRDKFDVKIEPVAAAELPNHKARAGVRIRLTAKPGLPIGRFNQWLALTTNLVDGEHLEIPILGHVVGEISVHGLNWNEEQGVLLMGGIKSGEGKREKLNLMIRGDGADAVKFDVVSSDPPELKAEIGEGRSLREDLFHVPVTIEVPAGTRPMVRTDTAQGDAGRIVLSTTHPKIKEVVLNVRFSVER